MDAVWYWSQDRSGKIKERELLWISHPTLFPPFHPVSSHSLNITRFAMCCVDGNNAAGVSLATKLQVNRAPAGVDGWHLQCCDTVCRLGRWKNKTKKLPVDLMCIHENVTRRTTLSWPSDRPSIHQRRKKKPAKLRVTIQSGVPHLRGSDTHKEMQSVS